MEMKNNHFNCIYRFLSPSKKSYVGLTKNFNIRLNAHKRNIKNNVKTKFYDACRKYDINNFKIEILVDNVDNYQLLNFLEKRYIKIFDSFGVNGYNMTFGGEGTQLFGEKNGMYNKKHTNKTKFQIQQNRKNKCCGDENPWHASNKTKEELSIRACKSHQSRKNNENNLTYEEKSKLFSKRSYFSKEIWKNNDMTNSVNALKYWNYKTDDELNIINAKKSNPGIKNGRALKFILKKNNTIHEIHLLKNIKIFCQSNQLIFNVINKYMNKGIIPEPSKYDSKYNRDSEYRLSRDNTTGWEIIKEKIK